MDLRTCLAGSLYPAIRLEYVGKLSDEIDRNTPDPSEAMSHTMRLRGDSAISHGEFPSHSKVVDGTLAVCVLLSVLSSRGCHTLCFCGMWFAPDGDESVQQEAVISEQGGIAGVLPLYRLAWHRIRGLVARNTTPHRGTALFKVGHFTFSRFAVFTACHVVLLLVDFAMTFLSLLQLFCVPSASSGGSQSGNAVGSCQNKWFVMVLLVLPFASLFVPIFGLTVIANQSSPGLRQYVVWNLWSLVNCVLALAVFKENNSTISSAAFAFPTVQICLKFIQAQLVPEQTAFIEARRPVKGWRGVYRSKGNLDDRVVMRLETPPAWPPHNTSDSNMYASSVVVP
jgi:hypothetical protein